MLKTPPKLPMQIFLYGTSGCHLCDLALQEVQPFIDAQICYVDAVDIVSDPELYRRYELSIPVLHNPLVADELSWPFTGRDVQLWLQRAIAQLSGAE